MSIKTHCPVCYASGYITVPGIKKCNSCNTPLLIKRNGIASIFQRNKEISYGNWMLIGIICLVPLVNLGYLIYLGAASKNRSLKNFALASLTISGILIIFWLILNLILR